ncbi:retrovirus-related Pol polyprotein from transposon opus [Trichonephila clavipes]|nr:retrovirus-related Pol polyprotein from transposon opus [Trichonephila clavipes]
MTIMSSLDLKSGYFQLAVNPSDIVKTAFVTTNGTYAFRRIPFGLPRVVPNFQNAIDIILKPVIGKFVSVYMNDVIISSPSFTHPVEHLREVFRLLQEAGLTLNKETCKFGCDEFKYLGLIISKEGIKTDETKVRAIVEMQPPRNSKEVSKFLVKLISDNGLQFISDIFEHLSDRLGIRHVKTVVYRPQANRTERVNRDLVQMISNYVNDQHNTWDQFLREFAYAIRTAVNETTGKPPVELFLGRKLVTPFQKLVMVSDGTEFAVGNMERLFDEAGRNTKPKRNIMIKWAKYYDRSRRDVQIKVNDWVLIKTHPLSLATKKVVAKFKPKFEGSYKVLESRPTNEKRTQQGGLFEPEEAKNISKAPTSKSKQGQQVRRPEAEVVNNSIARRGKEERIADGPRF